MAKMITYALALAALCTAGAARAPSAAVGPPLSPAGESAVPIGPTPQAACIAKLLGVLDSEGGKLDRGLATKSGAWGQVWRADITYPSGEAGRAVCWNEQLRLVRDQKLDPLPLPAAKSRKASGARCNYTPIDNPCRAEPVTMVWLCVRPTFYLYGDGHAEPAGADNALAVNFANRGAPESDAAWAARCAAKGGVFRAEE